MRNAARSPVPRNASPGVLLALSIAATTGALAPARCLAAGPEGPARAYETYRQAIRRAGRLEEVLPLLSASRRRELESVAPARAPTLLALLKALEPKRVRILAPAPDEPAAPAAVDAAGATEARLRVEGRILDALTGRPREATGWVHLVRERGAWRLDRQSWDPPERSGSPGTP